MVLTGVEDIIGTTVFGREACAGVFATVRGVAVVVGLFGTVAFTDGEACRHGRDSGVADI